MIEKFKSNAEAIAVADKYLYGNHARMPIVMDHGEGAWVWDLDGNKFLDFVGGIAVNGLGHNHPAPGPQPPRHCEGAGPGQGPDALLQLLLQRARHSGV